MLFIKFYSSHSQEQNTDQNPLLFENEKVKNYTIIETRIVYTRNNKTPCKEYMKQTTRKNSTFLQLKTV